MSSQQSTPDEETPENEAVLSLQETPAAEAEDEVLAHESRLSVAVCGMQQ